MADSKNTLVMHCLAVILNHFDVFMAAYESKSYSLPHLFEFLQKKYSEVMLYTLLPRGKLSETAYKFLICDGLKILDLTCPNFCDTPFLLQRLSEVGKSIRFLKMRGTEYTDADIRKMVELVPNVERLGLADTNANDDVLKVIGLNKQFHTLDISGCDISKGALEYLCETDDKGALKPNFSLKCLGLSGDKAKLVFALTNFPSLEVLNHDDLGQVLCDVFDDRDSKEILEISPKFNLTTLKVNSIPSQLNVEKKSMTEMLVKCAFLCPKVVSLELTYINDSFATSACTLFANLEKIFMHTECKIDFSPVLESFSSSLKEIAFINGILSVDLLMKYHRLEKLQIWAVQLQPITISVSECNQPAFENMTTLEFDVVDFAKEMEMVMLLINSSPNLQSMKITHSKNLKGTFGERICDCKCIAKLAKLGLKGSDINLDNILSILKCAKRLRELDIRESNISLADYFSIKAFVEDNGPPVNVNYDMDSDMDSDHY